MSGFLSSTFRKESNRDIVISIQNQTGYQPTFVRTAAEKSIHTPNPSKCFDRDEALNLMSRVEILGNSYVHVWERILVRQSENLKFYKNIDTVKRTVEILLVFSRFSRGVSG